MAALAPLVDGGLTLEEAAVLGMGSFPVAGEAHYTDDWLHARFTPTFHHHMGTDICAARGTPVRAPADGVVVSMTLKPGDQVEEGVPLLVFEPQ